MNRLARLAFALSITAAIGMQIPFRSGTALAVNACCENTDPGCSSRSRDGGSVGPALETTTAVVSTVILVDLLTGHGRPLPTGWSSSNSPIPLTSDTPVVYRSVTSESSESFQYIPLTSEELLASMRAAIQNTFPNSPLLWQTILLGSVASTPSIGAAASLMEVSSGTARELLDKCPNLSKQLASEGPFTMFLPSDAALASVKLDGAKLETFLKRHIAVGRYSYDELTRLSDGAKLLTLAETELAVTHGEDGSVLVAGVAVPSDAQEGSNGFAYTIQDVLP